MILFAVIAFFLSFIITVITHELGHMIGGMISGYKLVFISFFGKAFVEDDGLIVIKNNPGIGQCIMVPAKNKNPNPKLLASGGIIVNILEGVIALTLTFIFLFTSGISYAFIASAVMASVSLPFGISNMASNGTNDGATVREIKNPANAVLYNRLMMIYEYNVKGISFGEMPASIFATEQGSNGSILEEIKEYLDYHNEEISLKSRNNLISTNHNGSEKFDKKITSSRHLWENFLTKTDGTTEDYLSYTNKHIKKDIGVGEWVSVKNMIQYAQMVSSMEVE